MRVLAIDPGRTSAWYLVSPESEYLHTLILKEKSIGKSLDQFLSFGMTYQNIDQIIFEDPFVSSYRSARYQYGMTACIHIIADRLGAEVTILHPMTIKKFATQSGKASKPEMIAAAQASCPKSLVIENEHEADAFWMYQLWLSERDNA
jgi:Holliday junction resolvasome RuvABC endonuclease subunit